MLALLGGLEHAFILLDEYSDAEDLHMIMRNQNWNHLSRAILRVMLHPDRTQLFDFAAVYDDEVTRRQARFPNIDNERPFFEHFTKTWGVIKRD